jgi:predicted dehydrogenase
MLRLGIVGCGRVVEEAHVPALRSLSERATVVALADPSEQRRAAVSAALGTSPDGFAHWDEMLRVSELDVVVIAAPHHLHAPAICDAAAAGVDVIAEKPLATTLEDVDRVAGALADGGVRLSVMHNWMFNPDAQAALAAIHAGRIGTPFLVRNESLWGVPWLGKDPTGDWRTVRSASGGGIVIDGAYHPFYVSEAELCSPVVRVFASVSSQNGDVENTAAILLEHASGGTTSIQRSSASRGGAAGAHEIHGTEGSIRFRQLDAAILNLIMAGTPPPPPPPDAHPAPALEVFEASTGEWRPIELPDTPWWEGMRLIFERTFAAWATGGDAPVGLVEARRALTLVTAAYASAERHEAVEVAEFAELPS